MTDEPPVRLCCGQRHYGVQCPDGLVMCGMCFRRVSVDNLNVCEDGRRENVCLRCAAQERERIASKKN